MQRSIFSIRFLNKTFSKQKLATFFLSAIFVFVFASISQAAIHYVRPGATGSGNGSDWINAYTALPSTLVRGDTYYLADGNYGSYVFDDPAYGTAQITIKKATSVDHGINIGWSSVYGDGQAIFGKIIFKSDYFTIDGQVGGGPDSWTEGHGIKVYDDTKGYLITVSNVNHIIFNHIEVAGPNRDSAMSQRSVYGNSSSYISFSHCYFYNSYKGLINLVHTDNIVIEYSKIGPNGKYDPNDGVHSFGLAFQDNSNLTVRYNLFEDISETGHICIVTDSSGEMAREWRIHGNIFYGTRVLANTNNSILFSFASPNTTFMDVRFYNNTIANLENLSNAGFYSAGINGGGNTIENNIWFNNESKAITFPAGWSHGYNYFNSNNKNPVEVTSQVEAGALFKDMHNYDFSLLSPTETGLINNYNKDLKGNERGRDGIWDRGAIEYVENVTVTPKIDAPSNLTIVLSK